MYLRQRKLIEESIPIIFSKFSFQRSIELPFWCALKVIRIMERSKVVFLVIDILILMDREIVHKDHHQ